MIINIYATHFQQLAIVIESVESHVSRVRGSRSIILPSLINIIILKPYTIILFIHILFNTFIQSQ